MFSTVSFSEQVRWERARSCSPPWLAPLCRESNQLPPAQPLPLPRGCSKSPGGGKAGADAEGCAQAVQLLGSCWVLPHSPRSWKGNFPK